MPEAAIPHNEKQRLAVLRSCGVLDAPPDPAMDDLTRLAAELLDVPTVLVSLVDENRQWFMSRVGMPVRETPRSQAFCAHAILGDGPMVVPDATRDPRTADNPLVTGEPGIRFYAGAPLMLACGTKLGTLCAIDSKPREVAQRDLDRLSTLARQAASMIELRRAVGRLEQLEAAARKANAEKSAFLANMSHEIRTPLTAILGFTELLETPNEQSADDLVPFINAIRRNGQHLLSLVNDILDLSKIEAGQLSVERIPVDTADLVAEVQDLFAARASLKRLTFDVRWETPVPEAIETDPVRLRQVLVNLVSNALKFTESGGVALECSCDPERETLRVRVRDTGVGMTADQLAHIGEFAPFRQADNSATRRYGGTGLGLRISHLLARMLGGSLEIDSSPGRGTVATVIVNAGPLAGTRMIEPDRMRAGVVARHQAGVDPALEPQTPLAGRRILLAEDGPDNQRLIRTFLERAGASVTCVSNGRAAIEVLEIDPEHDLVLMDMQMPVLDGHATTTLLRESGFDRPIYALTAHAVSDDRDRALAAGCTGYLTKPIARKVLISACVAAIDRGRSWAA